MRTEDPPETPAPFSGAGYRDPRYQSVPDWADRYGIAKRPKWTHLMPNFLVNKVLQGYRVCTFEMH